MLVALAVVRLVVCLIVQRAIACPSFVAARLLLLLLVLRCCSAPWCGRLLTNRPRRLPRPPHILVKQHFWWCLAWYILNCQLLFMLYWILWPRR